MEFDKKIIEYILFAWEKGATVKEIEDKIHIPQSTILQIVQKYASKSVKDKHNKAMILRQDYKTYYTGEQIYNIIQTGKSISDIIDETSMSYGMVDKELKSYLNKIGKNIDEILPNYNKKPEYKKKIELPLDLVANTWTSGGDMIALANNLGVSVNILYMRIKKMGLQKQRGKLKKSASVYPKEQIIQAMREKRYVREVTDKFKISIATLYRIVDEHEIETGERLRTKSKVRDEKAYLER